MRGNMIERYARLPIDSPRQIILIVALLTLVISPSILNVEFETDALSNVEFETDVLLIVEFETEELEIVE